MESLRCPNCGRRFSVRLPGTEETWRCPMCESEFSPEPGPEIPGDIPELLEGAGKDEARLPPEWGDSLRALQARMQEGDGLTAHEFCAACFWLIDRLRLAEQRDPSLGPTCLAAERRLRAAIEVAWKVLPGLTARI